MKSAEVNIIVSTVLGLNQVVPVVGPHPPRTCGSSLGQLALGLLDISRVEVEQRTLLQLVSVGWLWHSHRLVVFVHVLNEPDDILSCAVGSERPGSIGVSDGKSIVGKTFHHASLPNEPLVGISRLLVNRSCNVSTNVQLQTSSSDDKVTRDALAVLENDFVGSNRVDVTSGDVSLALAQGLVEVTVGANAETLVPRVVLGLEVRVEWDILGELRLGELAENALSDTGESAEDVVRGIDTSDVLLTNQEGCCSTRKNRTDELGDGIVLLQREDVSRRALDQGDVLGDVCHGGYESDSSGTRANDSHPLSTVVVLSDIPELWVNNLALEVLNTGDIRLQSCIVVVVTSASIEEARPVVLLLSILVDSDKPASLLCRPISVGDLGAESDVFGDAVIISDLLEVSDDFLTLCNIGASPLLEGVTESVKIRVGSNTGVLEEVPSTTEVVTTFENEVLLVGKFVLETVSGVDTRDTGTDDEDVEDLGVVVVDRAHIVKIGVVCVCDDREKEGWRWVRFKKKRWPSKGR